MRTLKIIFTLLLFPLFNYAQLFSEELTAEDSIRGISPASFNALLSIDELVKNNSKRNKLLTSWAEVEIEYQSRAVTIGNLIKVIEGSDDFDRVALSDVIYASKRTTTSLDSIGKKITSEKLIQFQVNQQLLSVALSNLLISIDKYPNLVANERIKSILLEGIMSNMRVNLAKNEFYNTIDYLNSGITEKKLESKILSLSALNILLLVALIFIYFGSNRLVLGELMKIVYWVLIFLCGLCAIYTLVGFYSMVKFKYDFSLSKYEVILLIIVFSLGALLRFMYKEKIDQYFVENAIFQEAIITAILAYRENGSTKVLVQYTNSVNLERKAEIWVNAYYSSSHIGQSIDIFYCPEILSEIRA